MLYSQKNDSIGKAESNVGSFSDIKFIPSGRTAFRESHIFGDFGAGRPVGLVPLLQLADEVGQSQLLGDGDLLDLLRNTHSKDSG